MKTKMSTNKHTPGPWKAEGWENLVVNCAEGYTLTLAAGRKGAGLEELQANARLIASAPDLLAALYASEIALRSCLRQNVQVDAAFEQVRKAIERATGTGCTDHRSPEELAASYPRMSVWQEGEASK